MSLRFFKQLLLPVLVTSLLSVLYRQFTFVKTHRLSKKNIIRVVEDCHLLTALLLAYSALKHAIFSSLFKLSWEQKSVGLTRRSSGLSRRSSWFFSRP